MLSLEGSDGRERPARSAHSLKQGEVTVGRLFIDQDTVVVPYLVLDVSDETLLSPVDLVRHLDVVGNEETSGVRLTSTNY